MTKSGKKNLKAQAHHLNPVIMIGSNGLTPQVLDETNVALDAHELIKVKINGVDKKERLLISTSICDALGADFIQLIGNIAIIHRKNEQE